MRELALKILAGLEALAVIAVLVVWIRVAAVELPGEIQLASGTARNAQGAREASFRD